MSQEAEARRPLKCRSLDACCRPDLVNLLSKAEQERDEALDQENSFIDAAALQAERAEAAEAQLKEVLEAGREMERRWQEAEAQVRELREALEGWRDWAKTVGAEEGHPIFALYDATIDALQATQEDGAA